MSEAANLCINPACKKPADKLCPTCLEFGANSWFCNQECLTQVWKDHKLIHKALVDITTYFDGYHGDLNETIFIGTPSDENIRLVKCTYDCLANSMDALKTGLKYNQIGRIISKRAAEDKFSVVRTYCGHGVNTLFHCLPNVPHYENNKAPGELKFGHSFTIEPMINTGDWKDVTWPDNWTAATKDGKNSAQFEHTMVVVSSESPFSCQKINKSGPQIEVMTKRTTADPLPNNVLVKLSDTDKLHFEMYGRPHFIDQLVAANCIEKLYQNQIIL